MTATAAPSPFPVAYGFTISVTGGTPPYHYVPLPCPPNPPGVTGIGPWITVPPNTPRGTPVYVQVTDSSTPPQTTVVTDTVA